MDRQTDIQTLRPALLGRLGEIAQYTKVDLQYDLKHPVSTRNCTVYTNII